MHSTTVENYAEDSCLKNQQGENGGGAQVSIQDEEKSGVKSVFSPAPDDNIIGGEKADEVVPKDAERQDPEITVAGHLDDADQFPEGGLKAWSVVVGSFCGSFSVFGIINCTSVFFDYLQNNQLKDYSPSQIG